MRIKLLIEWIILGVFILLALWSLVEGINNRSRFKIYQRLRYYLVGVINSIFMMILIHISSDEENFILSSVGIIALTLIFGNLFYYYQGERIRNPLEMKFRLLKYILFSICVLFVGVLLSP